MTLVDHALDIAFFIFRYSLIGGIATFAGYFIGDQAKTRAIPRWSSWLAIMAFGFAVWHAPELTAAFGSGSQMNE